MTLRENEGMQPGTLLILLGICIAVLGFAFLMYQIMTCGSGCEDSVDDEESSCLCLLAPFILMIAVGTLIAAVGFLIRQRHRRSMSSDPARDAD